ncbi:hypothetical protein E2986_05150 [Frieseomelitta varia]|uniref:Uncharacterized protein n=1 Tax=Frieseomelitta varia TaxID=561572 RepID=A0A833W4R3_9HYME|nr:hypothetical protein E2986_05150 [Frieseomelitta varia]
MVYLCITNEVNYFIITIGLNGLYTMVAHTVLLDFTVPSSVIVDVEKRSNLKIAIANVLQEHFDSLKPLTESSIDGSFLVLYTGPKGSLITVRGYTEGLITVNIEYYKRDEEEALLDFELQISQYLIASHGYQIQNQLLYLSNMGSLQVTFVQPKYAIFHFADFLPLNAKKIAKDKNVIAKDHHLMNRIIKISKNFTICGRNTHNKEDLVAVAIPGSGRCDGSEQPTQ